MNKGQRQTLEGLKEIRKRAPFNWLGIDSDNGSEFIAQKIQQWLRENQIKTLYIDPGSPWQNGYISTPHLAL